MAVIQSFSIPSRASTNKAEELKGVPAGEDGASPTSGSRHEEHSPGSRPKALGKGGSHGNPQAGGFGRKSRDGAREGKKREMPASDCGFNTHSALTSSSYRAMPRAEPVVPARFIWEGSRKERQRCL